jgi:hypothetical protein
MERNPRNRPSYTRRKTRRECRCRPGAVRLPAAPKPALFPAFLAPLAGPHLFIHSIF